MFKKDVIFVLGSGRSGSSALTRVLSLCGCALPRSVFGADESNPKGFWEPADAAKLNLQFLIRHEWATSDSMMRIHGKITCDERGKEDYMRQIRAFLQACPDQPLLVVKEPLINELMTFWFEAARSEGYRIKIAIVVRNPHEVFASRAEFEPRIGSEAQNLESASAWWLRTNLLVERCTRSFSRVFIDYSNLMSDWRTEIARIARALSIDLTADEVAIDNFLTRDLHRQRRSESPGTTTDSDMITQLHAIFSHAARDGVIAATVLDDIYRSSAECTHILTELRKEIDLRPIRNYFECRPVWELGRDY